ncbi:MAG: alpha/beta hydrolase [Myxococcota bacterium]
MSAPEPTTFDSNGQALSLRVWEPVGPPKALLQIVHGMAEHIARYDRLARAFTSRGYRVFGHDHRGHGLTATKETLGHLGSFSACVEDLRNVSASMQPDPALPMGIFAHSLGSFMAQELLLQAPDHAGAWALSGSNGKPPPIAQVGRLVARIERFRLSPTRESRLLQFLSFGKFNDDFPGRTDFDWLSRDDAEVDKYVADPLCGFGVSAGTWVSFLDALGPAADPFRQRMLPRDTPLYLVGGDQDPVSEKGKGMRALESAYRLAGLRDVTLRLYEGARHEIVNETNRDEVTDALVAWFDERLFP